MSEITAERAEALANRVGHADLLDVEEAEIARALRNLAAGIRSVDRILDAQPQLWKGSIGDVRAILTGAQR